MSEETKPAAAKPARKGVTPLGVVIVAVIAVVVIVGGLFLTSGSLPPEPGQAGYLDNAVVAVSPAAFEQLRQAAANNSLTAMANLRADDQIFTVEDRTPILVVSSDDTKVQVTITGGPFHGRVAWAPITAAHRK